MHTFDPGWLQKSPVMGCSSAHITGQVPFPQRFLPGTMMASGGLAHRIHGSAANGLWMLQIGRNVTDAVDGILTGKRYLIRDRDPLFTVESLRMLAGLGVKLVKLPPRSPDLNAHAEKFVRSIKESCLKRVILFGESSLHKRLGTELDGMVRQPSESSG